MNEFMKRMLKLFLSIPDMAKMGFLTSFFKTEEEDFTDTEFVELDIVRTDEDIAPVLRDIKTGAIAIKDDIYTNKQIKPPVYSLERSVNIYELMKRQPGETEYAALGSWLGRLMLILKNSFSKMTNMIKRSIEIQAAQVLQTGKLDLKDENGKAAYELDYLPKATHFPTVTVSWSNPAAKPLDDLSALIDVIRDDGLVDVKTAIFGRSAWANFIHNEDVKEMIKGDGLALGALDPRIVNKGARYMGYIDIGTCRVDLFTYNGRYKNFDDPVKKGFIGDNNVILLPGVEDLDFRLVFGGIPSIGVNPPFDQILPDRVSVSDAFDFRARVYSDVKNDTYTGEIKSRPICIPVSIDRFGCLKTAV